jgi:uncharacterized protein
MERAGQFILTLGLALAGGILFTLAHIPLPWMLGPMTVTMLWTLWGRKPLWWHNSFRDTGLTLLGYIMGTAVTIETAIGISMQLPAMLAVTLIVVAAGVAAGILVGRGAGISMQSAMIGSIPGGLSQMIVLAEEVKGADVTVVSFMQTIRLLSVIFIVPFIAFHGMAGNVGAGAAPSGNTVTDSITVASLLPFLPILLVGGWIAAKLKIPTPYMLGPLLGTAVLVVLGVKAPQLPELVVIVAQLLVGVHVGMSLRLSSLSNWRRLLPYTAAGSVGIIVITLVVAYVLSRLGLMSMATAFLGTSPGGMSEMGVTAIAVGADLPLVTSYQMFRILFILFIVPPVMRWALIRWAA